MPKTKTSILANLYRLYTYTKPYKGRLYLNLLFAVLIAAIAPLRPYLIQLSVDDYIENKMWDALVTITLIQFGVLLLESIVKLCFTYISNWLGQTVVDDIRKAVFKKVIFQKLSYFDQTPIGTLTTRTVTDTEAINSVFGQGLISIIADILVILSIIGVMFYTDWRLTLVSLSVFPVLLLATYYFKEAVKKSFQTVRTAVSNLNAFVQEHLGGMYIVQIFNATKREQEKFEIINAVHRNANIKAIFAYAVFFPVVEIILALAIGLLVWYGANRIMGSVSSPGVVIAFIMYLNLLFRPLRMLADKFNTLQMGMVATERVMQVIDSQEVIQHNGTLEVQSLKGAILFEDVYFSYVEGVPVLQGLSLEAQPGETLALVGHTGAGKSSIISVLTRLYDIQAGIIKIDQTPLNEYNIYSLRKRIAVVLQDVFLFRGTVLDNITMSSDEIPFEKVKNVCEMIGIHKMITQLPGGYQFNIQERGNTLSQGQKQLLSFARALIFDPDILILDEATSSVDSESEQLIQHAIDKMIQGRTSIVIAHRLSTIQKADKIVVLEKGQVVEEGTHESLLDLNNGIYRQMHEAGQEQST